MSLSPLLASGWIITVHALAALLAIPLAVLQLAGPKGTALHRGLGWCWVVLLATVAFSGFFIHELQLVGPFSPIHLLSLFTLGCLAWAIYAARTGRVASHAWTMSCLVVFALLVTGAFTFWPGRVMYQVVTGG